MKVVTQLLDELVAQMVRVADSTDVKAVHRLRISVRRATQAIRLFQDDLPGSGRRVRREIRAIRRKAAAVRDRDVTYGILMRHKLPTSDPACAYLSGQRDLAASQLQRFLRLQLDLNRRRRWAAWLEE